MALIEELTDTGTASYISTINGVTYSIILNLDEKLTIHYDYMVAIECLEGELDSIISSHLKSSIHPTISICLLETIFHPPHPLLQILNLVVTVEEISNDYNMIGTEKIPIQSYNQFLSMIDQNSILF
ncbi:hypothetical protein [Rufibacter ruber]|uniref:hypothetical protein n=1 Tax=Rufibacter ruber TaxID=1783499 RepID=UPI00082CD5B7|nr:hypothetical protein [Rufibacter ruber]